MITQRIVTSLVFALLVVPSGIAADVCIRWHTGGTRDGTGWDTAYTNYTSASFNRGDTLWFADTDACPFYPRPNFNKAVSGGTVVTVKKATAADHGTSTGWDNDYGDGQCIFTNGVIFQSSNWSFSGNGTHTVPTRNPLAYGFVVKSDETVNTTGIIEIGASGITVTNIDFAYTHVTNTSNGSINNGVVEVRAYPSLQHSHLKLRNCWFQNCGKDGFQFSDTSFVLVERNWVTRLGKLTPGSPDYHGQTVQMFSSNFPIHDFVFRYNTWEGCEGQSLISCVDDGNPSANSLTRFRWYGDVIYDTGTSPGYNTSGGLLGNAWDGQGITNLAVYNLTVVDLTTGYNHFPVHAGTAKSGLYRHNCLFFGNAQNSSATSYTADSHNASGGGSTAGGTSEQTGLSSTVFVNYGARNFQLASAIDAGIVLPEQGWWEGGADGFFGALDLNVDRNGNAFTYRGALMPEEAAEPDAVTNIVSRISGPVTLSGKVVIQ